MAIIAQAPVVFSGPFTFASGTGEQTLQVTTNGTTAGLPAGNFYLNGPSANQMPGRFKVTAMGWIKAHGATQTVKPVLGWQAWNGNGLAGNLLDTFTSVSSATLIAGVFYDFLIEQTFYTEGNTDILYAVLPTVSLGGNAISITVGAPGGPLALPNLANVPGISYTSGPASQVEPVTGVNTTYNYPAVSFAVSFTNSVSDTVQTAQLVQFIITQE